MEYERLLRTYLAHSGIKENLWQIQKLPGSSSTQVFRANNRIFKIGLIAEARKELKKYIQFDGVNLRGRRIFPWIRLIHQERKVAIWEIENIGSQNFEDVLLKYNGYKIEKLKLKRINLDVLEAIKQLLKISQMSGNQKKIMAIKVFQEVIEATRFNLKKAELFKNRFEQLLIRVEIAKELFINLIPTLSHKDLTVGNIIIDNSGNMSGFIDPRESLPYLSKFSPIGSVAFDLIGYYVSLYRKELELQKENPRISLSFLKNSVKKEIDSYIKENYFNALFMDLCLLYWFSVYLACRCDYCTAPKRMWLYNLMHSEIENLTQKLFIKLT